MLEIEFGGENTYNDGGTWPRSPGMDPHNLEHSGESDHFKHMTDTFKDDCNTIDHLLELGLRKDRMEAMEANKENQARAEREAARKRREEATRLALKKEQEARDPKRRIGMKLENQRIFGDQDDETYKKHKKKSKEIIPMTTSDKIPIVDVRILQSRCMLLEPGGSSVSKLLDHSRHQERTGSFKSVAQASLSGSASAPDLFSKTMPSTSSITTPNFSKTAPASQHRWEDRLERVQMQKQKQHVEKLIHKLNTMRIKQPEKQRQNLSPGSTIKIDDTPLQDTDLINEVDDERAW